MSSNLPPTGPPSGPPPPPPGPPAGRPGPAWGPPAGPPPPSGPPPTWSDGAAEVLQSGRGGPIPPSPPGAPGTGGRGRRGAFIAGGALLGVGVLAAGAWAGYSMIFATGAQPAEALPDSTVGYVSVDLDPSGRQKLEALQALRKFPAFADNIDLAADDDLRLRLFEELQGDGLCPDLDFADDVDPWLGDRFAVAAIDMGGSSGPLDLGINAVGVVQVDDAEAAAEGLAALRACGGEDDAFGWSVAGDWAVVAETDDIAAEVTEAAADAPLAADDDFQRWTGEAGDPGILTAYVAPEAGDLLADVAEVFGGFESALSGATCLPPLGDDPFGDDPFGDDSLGVDPFGDDPFGGDCDPLAGPSTGMSDQLATLGDDFDGAALTIRFDDGGLELESAVGSADVEATSGMGDGGDDVVVTLPEDTAVAFGLGFEDGWFDAIAESADEMLGDGGLDGLLLLAEEETGLDLPDDLETLVGESAALALGGDADLTGFEEPEPPTDLELALKVQGDAEEIGDLVDRLVTTSGDDSLATLLGFDADDDFVVAGPSSAYRATVLEDGGLGDTDAYQDAVVNGDEAGAVLFVNFDAGPWLTGLPDLPSEVADNLVPLRALGFSAWNEDGVGHAVLRVTTE